MAVTDGCRQLCSPYKRKSCCYFLSSYFLVFKGMFITSHIYMVGIMKESDFEKLKKTYPDRIQEILDKHIRAGKKMIQNEVKKLKEKGEVP